MQLSLHRKFAKQYSFKKCIFVNIKWYERTESEINCKFVLVPESVCDLTLIFSISTVKWNIKFCLCQKWFNHSGFFVQIPNVTLLRMSFVFVGI
jgi:hypothetical protein